MTRNFYALKLVMAIEGACASVEVCVEGRLRKWLAGLAVA